jgi:hypothetical protein
MSLDIVTACNTPFLNRTKRNNNLSVKNEQMMAIIASGVNKSTFHKSLQNLSMTYPWLTEFFTNELPDPSTVHSINTEKDKRDHMYPYPYFTRAEMIGEDASEKIFTPISHMINSNFQDSFHEAVLKSKIQGFDQLKNSSIEEQRPFINTDEIRLLQLSFQDDQSPFYYSSSRVPNDAVQLKGVVTPERKLSVVKNEQPFIEKNHFKVDFMHEEC